MAKRLRPEQIAEARIRDGLQTRLAASMAAQYAGVIRADFQNAANAFRDGGHITKSDIDDKAMARAMATNWERGARIFGTRTLTQLRSRKRYRCAIHTKGIIEDLLTEELYRYGKKWLGKKIVQVSSTTVEQVRRIAEKYEGESIEAIARQIERAGALLSGARAMVIARTETHTIANWAGEETAKATGDPLKKQWAATYDSRTRDDHAEADGQTVSIGQAFDVGGESLEFPGDPSGAAENIIQCRCQCLYIDEEYR